MAALTAFMVQRQGVDSHSVQSPAWLPRMVEMSVTTVIVEEGWAVSLCLPDERKARNSGGKV